MMEAPSSSETLVLTRATWRNIPEGGILHNASASEYKEYKICRVLLAVLLFRSCDIYLFKCLFIWKLGKHAIVQTFHGEDELTILSYVIEMEYTKKAAEA
jgi:hypothetical protein